MTITTEMPLSNKVIDAELISVSPYILDRFKLVITCKVDEWSVNYLIKVYDYNYQIFEDDGKKSI